MKRDVFQGFPSVIISKIGGLFLTLLITPLLVRAPGRGQYSDNSFLISIHGIAMIVVNTGTFDGMRKFVTKNGQSKLD